MNIHTFTKKGSRLALAAILPLLSFNTIHATSVPIVTEESSIEWTTVASMEASSYYFSSELQIATDKSEEQDGFNVALFKRTTQSSYYSRYAGHPSLAVDGNTDGAWRNRSVTHTRAGAQQWWEVDLGEVTDISNISVWNRTDCCTSRLNNFHVFVSNIPFAYGDVAQTQAQPGVIDHFIEGAAAKKTKVAVNAQGRYVRVQLSSSSRGILSLAEVQVFTKAHQAVLRLTEPGYQQGTRLYISRLSDKTYRDLLSALALVDWDKGMVVDQEDLCDAPSHTLEFASSTHSIINTCGTPTNYPKASYNSLKAKNAMQRIVDQMREAIGYQ